LKSQGAIINNPGVRVTPKKKILLAVLSAGLPVAAGLLLIFFMVTGRLPTNAPAETNNGNSANPSLSADGRWVPEDTGDRQLAEPGSWIPKFI
jgi:hypothetical protein